MQSHRQRLPVHPTPQTPGSAKPPSTRETRPISGTARHTAQTPGPASVLAEDRTSLPPRQSTLAVAQRTAPSPVPLPPSVPCKNCTPAAVEWPIFSVFLQTPDLPIERRSFRSLTCSNHESRVTF